MKRNDDCWCGSKKKFKYCHFPKNKPPLSVIIINGHPCSGKSTLRSEISNRLDEDFFYEIDYDNFFLEVLKKLGSASHDNMIEAKRFTIEAIINVANQRALVVDVLLDNGQLFDLQQRLRTQGISTLTVRLFCSKDEWIVRNEQKCLANPDSPHGFVGDMIPQESKHMYDLNIDTTKTPVGEITDKVLQLAIKSIWL